MTEKPRTARGWEALVRGATMVVLTSAQPQVAELASRFGVSVRDARPAAQR
jgi:hypothetical protein